jgi:signal transduction histidine kinase
MATFNADVAHELRTPLAILQGETEIALTDGNLPDSIRAVLASNLEELQRLGRIIADMLTLAEAEAGTRVLTPRQVSVKELVGDLVEQMRLPATSLGVDIKLEPPEDVTIVADEVWLRRAVLNVLDNAIKYSRQGGRVYVDLRSNDSVIRLAIRDEGIGISADDLPRIFDRMYRADPARRRSTGGSGLGLSLVKWIVEAHGGKVYVESRRDQGSTFTLEFPRVSGKAGSTESSEPAATLPRSAVTLN